MKDVLHDAGTSLLALLAGLVPAALGAAVSLAYETGLTWTQRFVQLAVGTTVSYFATNLIGGMWSFNAYVLQAIGFCAGMVAFKATPKFIAACTEKVADVPAAVFDRIFPREDRP